jgi:hypothetical protein
MTLVGSAELLMPEVSAAAARHGVDAWDIILVDAPIGGEASWRV